MLTPKEIATELKVKEQTVMKWLREGTLKGVKLGKLWRVKEEDYKKFIEQGTPKGGDWDGKNHVEGTYAKS